MEDDCFISNYNNSFVIQAKIKAEQRKIFIGRFLSNKMIVSGFVIILFFAIISLFSSLIATHDPYKTNVSNRLEGPSKRHIMGTDNIRYSAGRIRCLSTTRSCNYVTRKICHLVWAVV